MVAERGDGLGDPVDSVFDPLRDSRARPLGLGRSAPVSPAEPDRGGEVLGDGVHLGVRPGREKGGEAVAATASLARLTFAAHVAQKLLYFLSRQSFH